VNVQVTGTDYTRAWVRCLSLSLRGLAVEAAVGPVIVVEVFPLLELVVEDLGVVDDHAVE
jgi:hypothetical protein